MIAAMLRVKNESRWIERVIRSVQPVCERIVVMDDASTDGTAEICSSLGAEVLRSPFAGLDETRDKNWLLARVIRHSPEWILCIDGDEELEQGGADKVRAVARDRGIGACSLRVAYLWDSPDQVRTDGVYGRFARPSMFRAVTDARFRSTGNGGNFHCGNVPYGIGPTLRSEIRLLHYGYMERADRVRKYEWYNRQDPNNYSEDLYRHMVIGDLFPADSQFRHGGPLKLETICTAH